MGRYNPFDGFVLCKIPAVVIIIFGDDTRILININDFPPIDQKLTKKHALEIGRVI